MQNDDFKIAVIISPEKVEKVTIFSEGFKGQLRAAELNKVLLPIIEQLDQAVQRHYWKEQIAEIENGNDLS